MNIKQLRWSRNKVLAAKNKRAKQFFLCITLFFVGLFAGMYFSHAIGLDQIFTIFGCGGAVTATIIGFGNIAGDPDNSKKVGKQVKSKIYFIEAAQYDSAQSFPARVLRSIGNIPLIAGEYWHYIDSVLDSPNIKWSGTMGDVAATVNNELTFILGGMEDDVFDVLEKGIGKGFYLVFEICATGDKFIAGNACKPIRMTKFEGESGKDQTATTVTFVVECGELWSKYTGNTPTLAPATVAANATTIALTFNPQYQLTTGSASAAALTAFTGTTDADINRIVTLLGSGGTYPSTLASSATDFLLIGGVTWTALAGKQISFKIFKDGDDSYKFVEVAGSRN
jgi:hypothetical protein